MILTELALAGAFSIDLDYHVDERGFFARLACSDVLSSRGLASQWPQINTSFTTATGTIRGLHFQRPPMADAKIVRCLSGAVFDVIVDLRPHSPTFGQWVTQELSAQNRQMVYVPAGFAHGFQTLQPDTEMLYLHSLPFSKEHDAGLRFDDPALAINWPLPPANLSPRDRLLPSLDELEPLLL
jgi:dTDP-4-dehydrorhamnose 3,5-epimerase